MTLVASIGLALVALAAWLVAIASAISILRLMPAGSRFGGFYKLGGWRFAAIEASAGPAVKPLIRRYVIAFGVFIAAVLVALVMSILLIGSEPAHGTLDAQAGELNAH